jgi:hypothetical protein
MALVGASGGEAVDGPQNTTPRARTARARTPRGGALTSATLGVLPTSGRVVSGGARGP